MVADKMNYIGNIMKWSDVIRLFPDRWVAIKEVTTNNSRVDDCELLDVLTDDEVSQGEMKKYIKNGVVCSRTTSGVESGYVDVRIFEEDSTK